MCEVCDALPSTRIKKMRILYHLQRAENLLLSAPRSIPDNKGTKSMYSYVIHMSVVCDFSMNRTRGLETNPPWLLLAENVITLKQKFQKVFFNTFATFSIFLLVLSILFTHALKGFESSLVSINVWNFPWMINGYWKFILFWCF